MDDTRDAHPSPYVAYGDDVEQEQPDERELTAAIVEMTLRMNAMMFDRHHRALRGQHAKSHAVLKATLTVHDALAGPLRQGLFDRPGRYDVIARLSSAPGDILADSVSLPKGFALKVLGVEGRMLPGHEGGTTQDFLLVTGNSLPAGDIRRYLQANRFLERHTDDSPAIKQAASTVAQGLDRALHAVGVDSKALTGLGVRNTHLLGETYNTLAALRYGDHVAKLSLAPASANLLALRDRLVDADAHPSIHRELVADFFRTQTAEFALRVQLCTDLGRMPVEDASVAWDEDESPFRQVATLTIPPQDSYAPARRVYVDESLSFSPWHGLEAHRPLGSIMRVRKAVYEASADYRRRMNAQPEREPRTVDEVPD